MEGDAKASFKYYERVIQRQRLCIISFNETGEIII